MTENKNQTINSQELFMIVVFPAILVLTNFIMPMHALQMYFEFGCANTTIDDLKQVCTMLLIVLPILPIVSAFAVYHSIQAGILARKLRKKIQKI